MTGEVKVGMTGEVNRHAPPYFVMTDLPFFVMADLIGHLSETFFRRET